LRRIEPGPREEVGYAVELDAVPRVHLYADDRLTNGREFAGVETQVIWKRAVAEGVVRPWTANTALVSLGTVLVDERRVELV
jgi:hypothetical protein